MAKKLYDAVASVGEYTDRNGQTKKRYVNIGTVFESDDGKYMSLKLESIPVGPNWSGWISFFEPKPRELSPQQQAHNEAKANGYQPGSTKDGGFDTMDSDIPFLFNMNTVCDTIGKPTSLWRAKYGQTGKEMLLLRANKADF